MKKLPVGISNLREIIEEGYAYVDKTPFVHKMVESGKYYFLSRPRRFGKSLFVDTLKEAFEGNRALFRGLWLHEHWDWEKRHPVIHISFAEGVVKTRAELDRKIFTLLEDNERRLGVEGGHKDVVSSRFSELIRQSAEQHGARTVVLIDEYDKPILDNITDVAAAAEMLEDLMNLYSVIKAEDANIRFALLTGVYKFPTGNLFSGLNNLQDISLNTRYSAICGYTEPEMTSVFAEHLKGKPLEKIRRWYNGYSWRGEKVCNPFSILSYLKDGAFGSYWFETGASGFLLDLLIKNNHFVPSLENTLATDSILGSIDIDAINIETIMFQTGYLTVREEKQLGAMTLYRLDYPNLEVRMSFADSVSGFLVARRSVYETRKIDLYRALESAEMADVEAVFRALFAAIPHDWYRKNKLAEYEGYYASVFYCYFTALGLDVTAEDATSHGRIDMTVKLDNRVFIFEFKVTDIDKTPGTALEQIKKKGYADKHRANCDAIYLIGLEFDRATRNIVRFEWARE